MFTLAQSCIMFAIWSHKIKNKILHHYQTQWPNIYHQVFSTILAMYMYSPFTVMLPTAYCKKDEYFYWYFSNHTRKKFWKRTQKNVILDLNLMLLGCKYSKFNTFKKMFYFFALTKCVLHIRPVLFRHIYHHLIEFP